MNPHNDVIPHPRLRAIELLGRLLAYALSAISILATASCFESASPLCSGGIRCPAGMFCSASGDSCVSIVCGNDHVDDGEVCDDGDNLPGDGCSEDCTSDETCGNGIRDAVAGEACDDGNNVDGDGCQANCQSPRCGDGILDAVIHSEECDYGAANSDAPDAQCRTNCQWQRCGDGIEDSDEVCDDGNTMAKDGCAADCQSDEVCGNGYPDALVGETCDDGNTLARDGCSSICLIEAPSWTRQDVSPLPRIYDHAMAYDSVRKRVVLFGDGAASDSTDTWEWDGAIWHNVQSRGPSPSPRKGHAMAYDVARRRVVLFGGRAFSSDQHDTWEWDGQSWYRIEPEGPSPSPRHDHAMVYDVARSRVVLVGGSSRAEQEYIHDDLWEWDGQTWHPIATAEPAPSPRYGHSMAFDIARSTTVLFGGRGSEEGERFADTWEWNGQSWRLLASGDMLSPSAGDKHAMVYDIKRARAVLFDGSSRQTVGGTWEWDGDAWVHRDTPDAPSHRFGHAMAYDAARGRTVLLGGFNQPSDTWEWDGIAWSRIEPHPARPSLRNKHTMAYDAARGRVVLFGGSHDGYKGDTWEWNGQFWSLIDPLGLSPSPRSEHAMVYDAARKRTVLFGGLVRNTGEGSPVKNDTWEWDGRAWHLIEPQSPSPPPRWAHAMAYDAMRKRTVLFAGQVSDGEEVEDGNDTWEWDGQSWHHVKSLGLVPPVRRWHAMTYDIARGRTVLFGGYSGQTLGDTWEWDGRTWHAIQPQNHAPSPRAAHAMTYDATLGRTILFSGEDFSDPNDTWTWDGQSWHEVELRSVPPSSREWHAMAYDAARGRTVLFGGNVDGGNSDETWHFGYESSQPTYESCHNDIDKDGDGFAGCDDADCWAYCNPMCPPHAVSCDPSAPHCGDGACNRALENHLNCPIDCLTVCGNLQCEPGESIDDCPADCR